MKFLVSSKYLMEQIKLAVQFKASRVVANNDIITFDALREINMKVHVLETEDIDIQFNTIRWQKVRNFLTDISEQPVTVELYEDRIIIRCDAVFVV
jgi:hypothetical protein